MPLLKTLYKSSLSSSKKDALLKKIKRVTTVKKIRYLVQRGPDLFKGNELTSFVVDDSIATGTLKHDAGPAFGVIASSTIIQDLTYTAKQLTSLFYPNDATIEYLSGGTAGAEVVTVSRRKISVVMEDGNSDADQIKAAIEGNAEANALVSISVSGLGSNAQNAAAESGLSGGGNEQNYNKADIFKIKRLRTKKYKIFVSADADPAA